MSETDTQSFANKYERHLELVSAVIVVLVGISMWWKGSNDSFWRALAPNFVAAGAVALLLFAAYGRVVRQRRETRENDLDKSLRDIKVAVKPLKTLDGAPLDAAVRDELGRSLRVFHAAQGVGLVSFYRDRPTATINDLVLQAHRRVDILEISLASMRGVAEQKWRDCVAQEVRIILLDPCFPTDRPLAKQRDEEEEQSPGQILGEVYDFVHSVPPEWFSEAATPKVKLARTMPTMSYFCIDDVAYVSPYVHKQVGHATLHLKLTSGGEYFDLMARHFEALWQDQHRVLPVDPAKLQRDY